MENGRSFQICICQDHCTGDNEAGLLTDPSHNYITNVDFLLLKISPEGPNTNWKLLESLEESYIWYELYQRSRRI